MKRVFQARERTAAGIITIILFSVFQYLKFLRDGEWGNYQSLAYCILALVMMLVLVLGMALGRLEMRKLTKPADWFFAAMLLVGMGSFLYKMFTARPDIERELILLAVPLSYYVCSSGNSTDALSLDLFLGAGTIIYLLLYLDFFFGEALGLTQLGTANPDRWFSWLLLSAMVSMLFYCNAKGRRLHFVMGLCFSLASFGLILLYQNVTLIYLTGMAILLLPVAHRPNREFLKRNLQLVFIWAAMLCNVRVLLEIAGLDVNLELYDVGFAAFLEVAAVLVGILVLLAWDNMPEEPKAQMIWLGKAKKGQLLALYLYIAFLFLLLSGSTDGWGGQKDRWVNLASLSQEWAGGRNETLNLFQSIYGDWGMLGVLFLGMLFLALFHQIRGRYRMDRKHSACRKQNAFLIPLGMLFLIQCFFWEIDAGTLPVYVWAVGNVLQERRKTALQAWKEPALQEQEEIIQQERKETASQEKKESVWLEGVETVQQAWKEPALQERKEITLQEKEETVLQAGKGPTGLEREENVLLKRKEIIWHKQKDPPTKEHPSPVEEIGT